MLQHNNAGCQRSSGIRARTPTGRPGFGRAEDLSAWSLVREAGGHVMVQVMKWERRFQGQFLGQRGLGGAGIKSTEYGIRKSELGKGKPRAEALGRRGTSKAHYPLPTAASRRLCARFVLDNSQGVAKARGTRFQEGRFLLAECTVRVLRVLRDSAVSSRLAQKPPNQPQRSRSPRRETRDDLE